MSKKQAKSSPKKPSTGGFGKIKRDSRTGAFIGGEKFVRKKKGKVESPKGKDVNRPRGYFVTNTVPPPRKK